MSTMYYVTADGRDLRHEEWRVIPGFKKYQITKEGDIRNRTTGRLLVETERISDGTFSYTLYKDNGKTTHRKWEGLAALAFPELNAGWKDIPGWPGYQVNKDGDVKGKRLGNILPTNSAGNFVMRLDGKRKTVSPSDLFGTPEEFDAFWEEGKEAA